jgi:hypothetical protein
MREPWCELEVVGQQTFGVRGVKMRRWWWLEKLIFVLEVMVDGGWECGIVVAVGGWHWECGIVVAMEG